MLLAVVWPASRSAVDARSRATTGSGEPTASHVAVNCGCLAAGARIADGWSIRVEVTA
jgi:hypothetical protein